MTGRAQLSGSTCNLTGDVYYPSEGSQGRLRALTVPATPPVGRDDRFREGSDRDQHVVVSPERPGRSINIVVGRAAVDWQVVEVGNVYPV